MKYRLAVLLVFSFTLFTASADIIYPDGTKPGAEPYAVKKIGRGISNILFFPVEVPRTIWETAHNNGIMSFDSVTIGVSEGIYRAGTRMASGVYDIGTATDPDTSLLHLEPDTINFMDIIPGMKDQFEWDTIGTPSSNLGLPGF